MKTWGLLLGTCWEWALAIKCLQLLGITLDKNLDFKCHVENICKKAGQKLHALARVAKFMDQEKLQTVMNAFILSQFSYCPVV